MRTQLCSISFEGIISLCTRFRNLISESRLLNIKAWRAFEKSRSITQWHRFMYRNNGAVIPKWMFYFLRSKATYIQDFQNETCLYVFIKAFTMLDWTPQKYRRARWSGDNTTFIEFVRVKKVYIVRFGVVMRQFLWLLKRKPHYWKAQYIGISLSDAGVPHENLRI